MTPPSVVVIGAGIIGCAIARELALAGSRVTVLDRGLPGGESSGAAAGLLAVPAGSASLDAYDQLALESWRLYHKLPAALRDETGVDVEHVTAGTLFALSGASEVRRARQKESWPLAGELGFEVVQGAALAALEPGLSRDVDAALLVHGEHWINNQRLVTAYAMAAARLGVVVRTGAEVTGIVVEHGRAAGVLTHGERLDADAVVVAAGAWSAALLAPFGPALPVMPVRGQMVALSHVPPVLTHVVHGAGTYVVPRPSGEVLIGATVEQAGFDRAVTAEGIGALIGTALRLVPGLAKRQITRMWCGLRPGTADGLPVLGPWPGIRGLHVATGHYRNGILLAPVTAAMLARSVLDGAPPAAITPFLPDRFI